MTYLHMLRNLLLEGVQGDIILHNVRHKSVILVLAVKGNHGFGAGFPHLHPSQGGVF